MSFCAGWFAECFMARTALTHTIASRRKAAFDIFNALGGYGMPLAGRHQLKALLLPGRGCARGADERTWCLAAGARKYMHVRMPACMRACLYAFIHAYIRRCVHSPACVSSPVAFSIFSVLLWLLLLLLNCCCCCCCISFRVVTCALIAAPVAL